MSIRHAVAAAVSSAIMFGAASAATLTVEAAPPGTNESDVVSCIFGNNSQGCPKEFLLPAGAPGAEVESLMRVYTVAEIRALVGNDFNVGIDSNTAPGTQFTQFLTEFTLSVVGGPVLASLDQDWEIDTPVAQGNGFTDYIIKTFSLAGLADDAMVKFTLSLVGLTDGAEQFYFLDVPDTSEIPLPGAFWLMGAGLAGVAAARRKRSAA